MCVWISMSTKEGWRQDQPERVSVKEQVGLGVRTQRSICTVESQSVHPAEGGCG